MVLKEQQKRAAKILEVLMSATVSKELIAQLEIVAARNPDISEECGLHILAERENLARYKKELRGLYALPR